MKKKYKGYIATTLFSVLVTACSANKTEIPQNKSGSDTENKQNVEFERLSEASEGNTQNITSADGNSGATLKYEGTDKKNTNFTVPSGDPIKLEQSVVGLVQSDKKEASEITDSEIEAMVRNAVKMAGGLEGLIKDGQTIVLKPNLVQKHNDVTGELLDKELNGITTDWRVTKAVVKMVRELNPNGKVYVMEGSAGSPTKEVMEHLKYTHEYIPGVDEFIAIEDSGGWQEFDSPKLTKVRLPNGLLHKEYYLNKIYKEADVLISLPCLKNNSGTVVTGAIKNTSIGATPANIYGKSASSLSRIDMVSHSITKGDLHKWIYDYYMCRPIDFVVMDGLEGFQNGPIPSKKGSEQTDKMNMRLILAGRDAVAVDTVEALITGWDPYNIAFLRYLNYSKMGNIDTSRITVVGSLVDAVRKNFSSKLNDPNAVRIEDNTPPDLHVNSLVVKGNSLKISLDVAEKTNKVEVYIDGKLNNPVITTDFDNISVDIGSLESGEHEVKIYSYDRFLNHSEYVSTITKK